MDCAWIGWSALKPEVQAAWVQAVGSVAAIFSAVTIAWWQWRTAREAQQALCRPHLTFEYRTRTDPFRFRIEVKNVGLGPAVISDVQIFVDDEQIPYADYVRGAEKIVTKLGFKGGLGGGCLPTRGGAIRAGDTLKFLRWKDVGGTHGMHIVTGSDLVKIALRVRFVITYSSIMGEELRTDSADELT